MALQVIFKLREISESQTRHKYYAIKNYYRLWLEIRRVGKEIMKSSFSEKKPVHQHGMTPYEDLEEKLMGKMRNKEKK